MSKRVLLFLLSVVLFVSLSALSPESGDHRAAPPVKNVEQKTGEQKTVEQKRIEWLDSRIPAGIDPAELSPDELEHFLSLREKEIYRWFSVQEDKLIRAVGMALLASLLCF